jgi:hypothetical protein
MSTLEAARALVRQKRGDQAGGVNSLNSLLSQQRSGNREGLPSLNSLLSQPGAAKAGKKTQRGEREKSEISEISLSDD